MSSVRSMDMNKSAKAMGLRETGTGRNARRRSRRPPYRPPSEPSAFYIIVEVCVVAGHTLQPCSRHLLEAVNGQRRHAHGRRNEEATRNLQALVAPQQAAGNSESERVGERDREYPPPPNLSQPRVMNHVMAEMT